MMLSSVIFMLLYWVLSAFELINIGELIKLRISEELCSLEVKNVEASKIRDLRMAWLGLVEMIKLNTKSWSYIFTYMVLTLLFVIIMTSFGFISILVKENRFDFDLLFVSLSVAALSYIMFECGHRLTHKAGYEICEVLGNVNILNMDKAAKEEVKFFTKAAKMNYPLVTLGGVFIANRAAMTSMVSSIVTNLIVILQLPKDSSSFVHLSNASNNTNIA
nr:gustatory receptor 63a [Apolygus lucorum]